MKYNQQRAIDSLIHDTNGKLGLIDNRINIIKSRLRENPSESNPAILQYLEGIQDHKKDIMNIIDKYYLRFKSDFSDESMNY